jgi:hypothetical protein
VIALVSMRAAGWRLPLGHARALACLQGAWFEAASWPAERCGSALDAGGTVP